jgi:MFS family permease
MAWDKLIKHEDDTRTTSFAVMTDTESHSPKDSCDKECRPISSFIVIYTMIFFNGCCFTAVAPSVPFYLEVLNAPASFLGWVVSFYSLGQIIGSPSGGWLADKFSSKCLLTGTSALGFISSLIYSSAPAYMWILVSRFLTGISAGMEITIELAFIAKNTTKKERTVYMASVTAANVMGFILGPPLAGLLSTLDISIFGLVVDKYTGPGWLLAIMFIVDIGMVQGFFKDQELVNEGGTEKSEQRGPPALPLVLGLIFVQFTVMCAFSVLETITSPLAEDYFGWGVRDW